MILKSNLAFLHNYPEVNKWENMCTSGQSPIPPKFMAIYHLNNGMIPNRIINITFYEMFTQELVGPSCVCLWLCSTVRLKINSVIEFLNELPLAAMAVTHPPASKCRTINILFWMMAVSVQITGRAAISSHTAQSTDEHFPTFTIAINEIRK